MILLWLWYSLSASVMPFSVPLVLGETDLYSCGYRILSTVVHELKLGLLTVTKNQDAIETFGSRFATNYITLHKLEYHNSWLTNSSQTHYILVFYHEPKETAKMHYFHGTLQAYVDAINEIHKHKKQSVLEYLIKALEHAASKINCSQDPITILRQIDASLQFWISRRYTTSISPFEVHIIMDPKTYVRNIMVSNWQQVLQGNIKPLIENEIERLQQIHVAEEPESIVTLHTLIPPR